jgi:hypothetical protein
MEGAGMDEEAAREPIVESRGGASLGPTWAVARPRFRCSFIFLAGPARQGCQLILEKILLC